jgi:PAS domain S-box-containing protein
LATLEQILEEAKRLPPEEQRRLRAALSALGSSADTRPAYRTNEQERAWINAHREEYPGKWVALDGDHLVADGTDAKKVYDEARERGITAPYLERVVPKQESSMGGLEIRQYYQALVENSPDPIIVLDDEGRVKVFNKACETIWGFSANEVIGQYVTGFYESESHARDTGRLLAMSPNHRIQGYPAKIRDKNGEIIPISLSASLLFDNQGNRIGSIGVFKDFRETLKLQEEKTNAERLATLGKLAHTVGHEIKHNIAIALNYVDTLAYESAEDEELSEIYRDIQESLGEAVDEFQNMLLVGRPKHPEKKIIVFEDLLRSMEASLRRRALSRKIEFSINYHHGDYELDADIAQLRQVLLNLFDNSIDAIEAKRYREAVSEKGLIELSAHANNGYLQIIWHDNGCGISAQNMPNIFSPFVTDKANGNGLGLFIVKSIIENHDGNISVESKVGKGTSFTIAIPLSAKGCIS